MNAKEAVRKALAEVHKLIAQSTSGEKETYEVFLVEFSNEIEFWDMRIDELNEDD